MGQGILRAIQFAQHVAEIADHRSARLARSLGKRHACLQGLQRSFEVALLGQRGGQVRIDAGDRRVVRPELVDRKSREGHGLLPVFEIDRQTPDVAQKVGRRAGRRLLVEPVGLQHRAQRIVEPALLGQCDAQRRSKVCALGKVSIRVLRDRLPVKRFGRRELAARQAQVAVGLVQSGTLRPGGQALDQVPVGGRGVAVETELSLGARGLDRGPKQPGAQIGRQRRVPDPRHQFRARLAEIPLQPILDGLQRGGLLGLGRIRPECCELARRDGRWRLRGGLREQRRRQRQEHRGDGQDIFHW